MTNTEIDNAIRVGDTLTNLIDVNGLSVNYNLVTQYYDGTTMDESKVDGKFYIKKGDEYFRKVIDRDGELFLEKDSVVQMKSLSDFEILALKAGVYKGIRLHGYYDRNDTPFSIEYSVDKSNTLEDGGSVFEIGSTLKVSTIFGDDTDVAYFGAVPNVPTDQAPAINQAIAACDSVVITKNYYISTDSNYSGVVAVSNRIIKFLPNGQLTALPSTSDNYRILRIYDCDNVKIYNPKIVGERYEHLGSGGEWGHGISVTNSSNILLDNPNINNTWGDGIYVGVEYFDPSLRQTVNVTINSAVVDACRRNGISISSCSNVDVINPKISNINGTSPQCGIDIEPEGNSEGLPVVLNNINVSNLFTTNCAGAGLLIVFDQLLPENNEEVNVSITNHRDIGSQLGLSSTVVNEGLDGKVTLTDPRYKNNKNGGILISNWGEQETIHLDIIRPKIENWNTSNIANNLYNSAIGIIKDSNDPGTKNTNIYIENFTYKRGSIRYGLPFLCNSALATRKSVILNGITSESSSPVYFVYFITTGCLIHDRYETNKGFYWEENSNVSPVLSSSFSTVIDNENNPDYGYAIIQPNGWTDGQMLVFANNHPTGYFTVESATDNIFPKQNPGSRQYQTLLRGGKLYLQYNSANSSWNVIKTIGIWNQLS